MANIEENNKETLEYDVQEEVIMEKLVEHYAFNQYSLKQAINKFGPEGERAAYKEMEQLHKRETFKPIDPKKVDKEIYDKALESLIKFS